MMRLLEVEGHRRDKPRKNSTRPPLNPSETHQNLLLLFIARKIFENFSTLTMI